MDAIYLVINGQSAGPFTRAQVQEKLARGEINAETLAWHDGLADWKPVSALLSAPAAGLLPPAPVPAAIPAAGLLTATANSSFSKPELRKIASSLSLLMWAVLTNIAVTILSVILNIATGIQHIGLLLSIPVAVFMIYSFCQLGSAMRYPVWLIVLLCFTLCIPCVSLIVLVILSIRATTILKAHGVRVGLMGANPEDIRD